MTGHDGYVGPATPDADLAELRRWAHHVDAYYPAKLADLEARIRALEDRASGHDTGDALEFVAVKARLRRLEERLP